MKFSIVVPIYNVEKYISQCVENILRQTFNDFELILVNDGSKDLSPQICDKYASRDNRVRVIHKENAGVSSARNSAIRAASGEYICFLDGDDYWKDEYVLEKIHLEIAKNNVDLMQLNYCFFDEFKQEILHRNQKYFDNQIDVEYEEKLFKLIQADCFTASAWGTVISREFVNLHSLYFIEGVRNTEDVEWAIRAFSFQPKFCVLNEEVYVYRKNREGAVTSNISYENLCQHVDTITRLIKLLKDKPQATREPLMNYVMYQMVIAIGLLHSKAVKMFQASKKKVLDERLSLLFEENVRNYQQQNKVRLAAKVYSFGGYKLMAKLLGFYLNKRHH